MQGSLDKPPIIIHTSLLASGFGLALCLGALLLRVERIASAGALLELIDYLWLIASGGGSLIFLVQLLRPSYLKIAHDGLTWRAGLGCQHWNWDEIGDFHPGVLGCIKIEFVDGSDGAFGIGWEGGTVHVVSTLKAARVRWLL